MQYKKHFVPLESDPQLFTRLLVDLGGSEDLQFVDLWTLEQVPERCLALILLFHDHVSYSTKSDLEFQPPKSTSSSLWIKQTIHNACGLYAMLHAACNGPARTLVAPNSFLAALIEAHEQDRPLETILEASDELESKYSTVANQGSTSIPEATDEVDHHYICFSSCSGPRLWLLDGDNDGPLVSNHDVQDGLFLNMESLTKVRDFLDSTDDKGASCAMMALTLLS